MTGLLAGLLAVAALPPVGFAPAGLVWLVPWLMGMRQSRRTRVRNTLIALGLPMGMALGPVAGQEPALAIGVMLTVLAAFIVVALAAADRHGVTHSWRLVGAMVGLIGLLAGLRSVGIPISLSLFLPPSVVPFRLVDAGGVITADAALGLWQTGLAIALMTGGMRPRPRAWLMPTAIALGLAPVILIPVDPPPDAPSDAPRIAIVQTLDDDPGTSTALAHAALARIEARWVVWPEAASPVLLPPPWQRPPGGMIHLRHGYRYLAPGKLRSEVSITPGVKARNAPTGRWTKAFPLPFAEAALSTTDQPDRNDLQSLEVLICSDASHPRAVDRAVARGPRLIVNPAHLPTAGLASLGGLHRRSVHLQAARSGVPILVVAHGGPSMVLHPDGRRRRLAPAGVQAVATLPLPAPPAADDVVADVADGPIAPDEGASHRAAIARLTRAYGLGHNADAVPAARDRALVWLCEQTGLMAMNASVNGIRPPAYGLQPTPHGLRAIRWLPGEAADAPGIRWLATVDRPERCRSAGSLHPPTSGTSRLR
jgi:apolipoprotein N-acyltransferase